MGLLKTIGILIIIYYLFKFFSRYIAPIFLKKVVNNMEEKIRKQQEQQQQANQPQGEVGETVIAKKAPTTKESNKSVGDYVDYEEIND